MTKTDRVEDFRNDEYDGCGSDGCGGDKAGGSENNRNDRMSIEVISEIRSMRTQIRRWKQAGQSIGLVPTMGYLHEGHQSLIERSVSENDRTVVSVFVNKVQFSENEDFDLYPRDLSRDCAKAQAAAADVIFHPSAEEMYPFGHTTTVHVEKLGDGLCGRSRKGHFDGVCLVVSKLFHIIDPDRAYFGEKDAQQLAVVKRMVRDLDFDIDIVSCPIVREADGLAKSSRNARLDAAQRTQALALSKALIAGKTLLEQGVRDSARIRKAICDVLDAENGAEPEYVEIVDKADLQPIARVDREILCALAVRIGNTRLIDNFSFMPDELGGHN